jgi:hypothetical protein
MNVIKTLAREKRKRERKRQRNKERKRERERERRQFLSLSKCVFKTNPQFDEAPV